MNGKQDFNKERVRTAIILFLGFLVLLFLLIKEQSFFEAKVYGAMGIFSILILFAFPFLWKHSKRKESLEKAYIGISNKPFRGIFIGIAFAAVFIIITQIKFFGSVAQLITPSIPLSLSALGFVVILIAPLFEEFAFTTSFSSLLQLYMPFWVVAIIKGAFFSAVHFFAFVIVAGSSLENAAGAFIGAGIFGISSAYIGKYFGVEASQTGHGTFNLYNFNNVFHVLTVTGGM